MANTGSETLEFIVKEKPGGHASRYLFDELSVGDRVSLEGPYGRAYLRTPLVRDIICVAGGSGLAPVLSVARGALARSDSRAVRLFFGVNGAGDLFMIDTLEALAADHDQLSLTVVVRDGAPGAETGLVGDIVLSALDRLSESDLYMAGPPGLIDALLRPVMRSGKIAPAVSSSTGSTDSVRPGYGFPSIATSINRGALAARASRTAALNSSGSVTRTPATPMPAAMSTKPSSGSVRSICT